MDTPAPAPTPKLFVTIEMMGRQQITGTTTIEELRGLKEMRALCQVETLDEPPTTVMVAPGSVFRLTVLTEEQARHLQRRQYASWLSELGALPPPVRQGLPARAEHVEDDGGEEQDSDGGEGEQDDDIPF